MNQFTHFINGDYVKEDNLLISPRDLGFARGYAVSDFLITQNLKPLKLSEHVDRLFSSAKIIDLKIPWSKKQVSDWIIQTLDKNNANIDKTVKIFLTGGKAHLMFQEENPTIIIIIGTYIPQAEAYYKNGVKAKTVKYERQFPQAKTTQYSRAVIELSKSKVDGVSEIIYYNNNQVFEGGGCNVFAAISDRLITPKSNIVKGITRNTLLEILKLNIEIIERDFTYQEMLKASEIFLTGTSKKVRGVINLDGRIVGNGIVGHITNEVMKQYNEYLAEY